MNNSHSTSSYREKKIDSISVVSGSGHPHVNWRTSMHHQSSSKPNAIELNHVPSQIISSFSHSIKKSHIKGGEISSSQSSYRQRNTKVLTRPLPLKKSIGTKNGPPNLNDDGGFNNTSVALIRRKISHPPPPKPDISKLECSEAIRHYISETTINHNHIPLHRPRERHRLPEKPKENLRKSERRPLYLFFDEYIPLDQAKKLIQESKLHQGVIRINKKRRFDAYVTTLNLSDDIYIPGERFRNRAFDGDEVAVQILEGAELETELERQRKWKSEMLELNTVRQQKCDFDHDINENESSNDLEIPSSTETEKESEVIPSSDLLTEEDRKFVGFKIIFFFSSCVSIKKIIIIKIIFH